MLLLVDLDGVVYRASEGVPGVGPVLAARALLGDEVVYVTNNAMFYRTDYVPRLAGHGAPVGPDRVMTSARAAAVYLRDTLSGVRRVLVVGARLEREVREVGLDVVSASYAATRMGQEGIDERLGGSGRPDAVVVGLDPQLTYLKIAAAADCVRAGAGAGRHQPGPGLPVRAGPAPGGRHGGGGDRDGGAHDRPCQHGQARAVPAGGCRPFGERRPRICRHDRGRAHGRRRRARRRRAHDPDAHRRVDAGDGRGAPGARASDADRRGRRTPPQPSSPSSPRTRRETSSAIGAS